MGDITSRMTGSVERNGNDGLVEIGGTDGDLGHGRGGERDIKLALSGCHDTTLAACLSSLGAFEGEKWPPFTSHVAFELFRKKTWTSASTVPVRSSASDERVERQHQTQSKGWWKAFFGGAMKSVGTDLPEPEGIARKSMEELTDQQKDALKDYYVRIRYNDRIMQIPGCKADGNHLEGDTTFCTLVGPSA